MGDYYNSIIRWNFQKRNFHIKKRVSVCRCVCLKKFIDCNFAENVINIDFCKGGSKLVQQDDFEKTYGKTLPSFN